MTEDAPNIQDNTMAHICLSAMLVITILFVSQEVHAKRGCFAFGHSCLGGHGKRSGDTGPIEAQEQQQLIGRQQTGQEEIPPHPGYPRTNYNGILSSADDIIPVRDGGIYDHDENIMKELMKIKLRNIVKHWMENYRRSQQNSDEGFFIDTL